MVNSREQWAKSAATEAFATAAVLGVTVNELLNDIADIVNKTTK